MGRRTDLDAEYGLVTHIGRGEERYITRVKLTPMTRWGQLYLHVFHRPDMDPDPHDHPFHFWTFPFIVFYEEEIMNSLTGDLHPSFVWGWRWSRREPTHTHKVVGWPGRKMITLVWRGPNVRAWGFWVRHHGGDAPATSVEYPSTRRQWVHWRDYLNG